VKSLLVVQLLAGLFLTFVAPAFERASTVALWSDFMAFQARVRADEAGARILSYGGEDPKESFEQLLNRLWQLPNPTFPRVLGILISVSSGCGLFLLSRTKRTERAIPSRSES
jgi:hypothetical protein